MKKALEFKMMKLKAIGQTETTQKRLTRNRLENLIRPQAQILGNTHRGETREKDCIYKCFVNPIECFIIALKA